MNLPNYTLRYSKKAKYLQLRLSSHGLEVVAPIKKQLANHVIEQFIQQKQLWIEKNWHKICQNRNPEIEAQILPTQINLNAMNQTWEVVYIPTSQKGIKLLVNLSRQISLIGDINNKNLCVKSLRLWLKQMAQDYLHEELISLAKQTKLTFQKMSIHNNTSRWGSCSSQGNINLCCKLLLLPPLLMRHVLLHELCHTKAMHHGKKFWKLLSQFDPAAKIHAKQLKTMPMPWWIK